MQVSRRSQYAIRAVLELALRRGQGTVTMPQIAEAQAIPLRFLESIMMQLKQGGFVDSRRGAGGGYILTRAPERISVGDVLRYMEGPLEPVECLTAGHLGDCRLGPDCIFAPMWREMAAAAARIYDGTTFDKLVKRWLARPGRPGGGGTAEPGDAS